MATSDDAAGEGRDRAPGPRSRLFAVRLWAEEVANGREYRGNVQEVVSGAFRSFRDWSELIAFMVAQMEEEDRIQTRRMEGGMP
jgi:hypothetical protein